MLPNQPTANQPRSSRARRLGRIAAARVIATCVGLLAASAPAGGPSADGWGWDFDFDNGTFDHPERPEPAFRERPLLAHGGPSLVAERPGIMLAFDEALPCENARNMSRRALHGPSVLDTPRVAYAVHRLDRALAEWRVFKSQWRERIRSNVYARLDWLDLRARTIADAGPIDWLDLAALGDEHLMTLDDVMITALEFDPPSYDVNSAVTSDLVLLGAWASQPEPREPVPAWVGAQIGFLSETTLAATQRFLFMTEPVGPAPLDSAARPASIEGATRPTNDFIRYVALVFLVLILLIPAGCAMMPGFVFRPDTRVRRLPVRAGPRRSSVGSFGRLSADVPSA